MKKTLTIISLFLILFNNIYCLNKTKTNYEKNSGDLKIALDVSVSEFIKSLAGNDTNIVFNNAIDSAVKKHAASNLDFVSLFAEAILKTDSTIKLASYFCIELKDKIKPTSTNIELIAVLKAEVDKAMDETISIIKTRLKNYDIEDAQFQKRNQQDIIVIKLRESELTDRLRKLIQSSANIEFWNTYEFKDLVQNLENADKLLSSDTIYVDINKARFKEWYQSHPLYAAFVKLNIDDRGVPNKGPCVGMAETKDIPKINKMLKAAKNAFPADVKFLWTAKPINTVDNDSEIYQLIAIKLTSSDNKPPLTSKYITKAYQVFNVSHKTEVSMTMNKEGAKLWQNMTADAAPYHNCIAIVLDDLVYAFPTVNSEIESGRSSITGDFTEEETKDLANILMIGALPLAVKIIYEYK